MNAKPRFVDLLSYAESKIHSLSLRSSNPELQTFCKLKHILNVSIEGCLANGDGQEDDHDGCLSVVLKYGSDVKELQPLDLESLDWLEHYFGATLKEYRCDHNDGGGGYVYYRMCMPSYERAAQLYDKYPFNKRWNGCGWVE